MNRDVLLRLYPDLFSRRTALALLLFVLAGALTLLTLWVLVAALTGVPLLGIRFVGVAAPVVICLVALCLSYMCLIGGLAYHCPWKFSLPAYRLHDAKRLLDSGALDNHGVSSGEGQTIDYSQTSIFDLMEIHGKIDAQKYPNNFIALCGVLRRHVMELDKAGVYGGE